MTSKRLHTSFFAILLGIILWGGGHSWGSDSIVGWTTTETVISDGKTTLSSGTIYPVYSAPGVGKYILIDGKRYIEAGNNRFAIQTAGSSSGAEDSREGTNSHRSHKHRHHHPKHPEEDWKKLDAERNAAMTPSQKIYRDLKKNTYPELFEK